MKPINEVRRNNLLKILTGYGSDREFCDSAGIATGYLSQLKMGGKPIGRGRNIGEKLARKLELSLNLSLDSLDDRNECDLPLSRAMKIEEDSPNYTALTRNQRELLDVTEGLSEEDLSIAITLLTRLKANKTP